MGRSLRQKDRANVFCAGSISCAESYAAFFAGRAFGKEVLPAFCLGYLEEDSYGRHRHAAQQRGQRLRLGPFGLALLFCTGLWLSIRTGFFQFRRMGYWLRHTIGAIFTNKDVTAHTSKEDMAISQFQSMCTALAGTIGTGNIVENQVDLTKSRNLIIAAVMFVSGLGFSSVGGVTFTVGGAAVTLSGLAIAALDGLAGRAACGGDGIGQV